MRSRPIRAGPCATPPMWPRRPRRPSRNCQCCGSCTRVPRALTATRREWEKRNEFDMTDTRDVFLCDAVRTPIGRYGGALAKVRTDDLAAIPIKALIKRHPKLDWAALDEIVFGCANQAGEDNRNVARMALLLAGLPETVPGVTVNRLCGSGLEAVNDAARRIRDGEADIVIAGGGESLSRAPLVTLQPSGGLPRGGRRS